MLRHTFCHLPGVGPNTERKFWDMGLRTWEELQHASSGKCPTTVIRAASHLKESFSRHHDRDAAFFAQGLPAAEVWRLFPDYHTSIAYVDIETTGLGGDLDHITTIALYDGRSVRTYVHGRNLEVFQNDIREYKLLVSFNGRCFDVPFIERQFRIHLNMAHIDLRCVMRSLGVSGGLKKVEKKFGLSRKELEGVDGLFAVRLWNEYQTTRDDRYLETLLAYNVADVLSLEILLALAFNRKIEATPFYPDLIMGIPDLGANPHVPESAVLERLGHSFAFWE